MLATKTIEVYENAIANRQAILDEVIPKLIAHPVPQSDARTKGLLFDFEKRTLEQALLEFPHLHSFVAGFVNNNAASYILAANQTPPTCSDDFLMRPHIDRRWQADEFKPQSATWTMVMFLDFSPAAVGGELVVFEEPAEFDTVETLERKNVRHLLKKYRTKIIEPIPGRVCKLPGHLPHAVLGYDGREEENWRLTLILAEFTGEAF